MPKTRTDTTVMKIIITIARFSMSGVGTLSGLRSGPNPGSCSVVTLGPVGGSMVGGFVIGMVDGGCVDVLDKIVIRVVISVVVVVVVVVVDIVVDVVVVDGVVEGGSSIIISSSVVVSVVVVVDGVGKVILGMVGGDPGI